MGQYDTGDLHRRQQTGDVGHAVLGSPSKVLSRRRRRALLVPLTVLALGILLGVWGPLPGLGVVLTIGGLMGLVIGAGLLLTDGFS